MILRPIIIWDARGCLLDGNHLAPMQHLVGAITLAGLYGDNYIHIHGWSEHTMKLMTDRIMDVFSQYAKRIVVVESVEHELGVLREAFNNIGVPLDYNNVFYITSDIGVIDKYKDTPDYNWNFYHVTNLILDNSILIRDLIRYQSNAENKE